MYRDRRRLASNSRYSRTMLFTEIGLGAPDSPSSPSRGPLIYGPEVEDRSKPRQISSHTIRQVIDRSYSTRPPLTAPAGQGREPTRDGFLRHPMPRRLPGVVQQRMSRAVGTACCPGRTR
ncbi:hypothetical protein EVAR_88743_1 [Eumeta japonica]|uniref:Uncharacterized protein n=1 Tax=Eumeta variegata TaxID=151549 RepID=A0A4C1XVX5_EUMVA|nr:hypothetical protein EVAR_88743_1 [Eumeta japonica]